MAREPEQQLIFLKEACAGDDELFRRVKDLLDSYAEVKTVVPVSPKSTTQLLDSNALIALGERYEDIKPIGAGGMGIVFRARDRELGKFVALKIVHPSLADDERVIERFRNEIRLALEITHKNVCRTYGLERVNGLIFISMEYIEGDTLHAILERARGVSVPQAIQWTREICDGLAAAHEKGIIHRDLKPENIMIDRAGHVKVMDFGIARAFDGPSRTSDTIIGTLRYMSPEQAIGKPAGPTADIYSLGLVLYEMVTGAPPDRQSRLLPSELNPHIPAQVRRVILKCLQNDPAKRFQSVKELAAALSKQPIESARHWRNILLISVTALLIAVAGLLLIQRKPVQRSIDTLSPAASTKMVAPVTVATQAEGVVANKPQKEVADVTAPKIRDSLPLPASGRRVSHALQGTWFVRISDVKGSSYFDVKLVENSDGHITGIFLPPFQGVVQGDLKGEALTFELNESLGNCSGHFTGTANITASKGTGAYTGSSCTGDHGKGTLLMAKWSPAALAEHEEMRKQKLLDYLLGKLLTWAQEDARAVMGDELMHRYGYDDGHNVMSDIYTYADPSFAADRVELGFDSKTKRLTNVYVYPLGKLTADDVRKSWGDNFTTKDNPDGTKLYLYNDRALNVFFDKDGKVVSLGLYKRM